MRKEERIFEGMKYIISYPEDFDERHQYPVILFLHGAGSRGQDTSLLKTNPYFTITDTFDKFPFVSIAPLCYENTWFDLFETLKRFVLNVVKLNFADKCRIFLMGASMGGYAVWQLAMSMPEYFAAIVPICGGGMYWNAGRLVEVPIWAFHGGKDKYVLPDESRKMVDAVNKNGGRAKLTIYPENGHDAWSDTYANNEVYAWLLKNSNNKNRKNDARDSFQGSASFG